MGYALKRRWFVTGCAGFIGSHVVRRLLELGQDVVGVDDFSTGRPRNLEEATGDLCPDPEGTGGVGEFAFRQGSLLDSPTCASLMEGADGVFHFAAFVSVPRSVEQPLEADRLNVHGFLSLLENARMHGVSRFVYASSSAVYGDEPTLPKREDMPPLPLSPYGVGKVTGELYARVYARLHGMCTVGLRFFNVYGPRQDPQGEYAAVIAKWTEALARGRRPEVYGDGSATRDFCHVSDVVRACLGAAAAPPERVRGEVYNIGSGQVTDLLGLFQVLRRVVGEKIPPAAEETLRFCPPRSADIPHSSACIERARRDLGYVPSMGLEEGLRDLIASLHLIPREPQEEGRA